MPGLYHSDRIIAMLPLTFFIAGLEIFLYNIARRAQIPYLSRREVHTMFCGIIGTVIAGVVANVISHFICKWLDRE